MGLGPLLAAVALGELLDWVFKAVCQTAMSQEVSNVMAPPIRGGN
jgi:hypothetical protein